MARTRRTIGIAVMAMLMAQPCFAAQDYRDGRAAETRTGAFAGVRLRLPLDADAPRRPTARLQFTGIHQQRDADGATRTSFAQGVQIGATRDGRPALTIAGQNPFEVREQHRIGGSTGTTLLIVGGVVLIVFVLAAVAAAQPTPGPHPGDFK